MSEKCGKRAHMNWEEICGKRTGFVEAEANNLEHGDHPVEINSIDSLVEAMMEDQTIGQEQGKIMGKNWMPDTGKEDENNSTRNMTTHYDRGEGTKARTENLTLRWYHGYFFRRLYIFFCSRTVQF